MCFTLFGITVSISRAARTEQEETWYVGVERFDPERWFKESRVRGERLLNRY